MFDIFHTLFRFKEKESPDKLGFYPERVHVDAFPERRYLWTSRLLVILSGMSICFNMMLACAIYLMLPQIEVIPKFYRINEYFNRVEIIQPQKIRYPVSDLITEQYIREYIVLRYTITDDYQDLMDRWGEDSSIYWYSSAAVYSEFKKNEEEHALAEFKKSGLVRFVDIEWVKPLSFGLWQVQFKTTDYLDTGKIVSTYWRAMLRIKYVNLRFIKKEKRSINPYGFLVVNYSLAYHGAEGDDESYINVSRRRSQGR